MWHLLILFLAVVLGLMAGRVATAQTRIRSAGLSVLQLHLVDQSWRGRDRRNRKRWITMNHELRQPHTAGPLPQNTEDCFPLPFTVSE